ncbi:MAG: GHKL domain-containing protein, partial [Treponema sp.]|nr:GHKL domain-containing protein [Treponema sp.]
IVWNFSRIAVEPVEEAFLRQRNFIADASHELKTPIAVIGANIDVVEQELPGNKWLGYIKTENSRMAELVKNLLYLAKNDADRNNLCMMKFDFANAVEGAALPFESVAMEQGKSMDISVPEEPLWVMGDESHIKQVAVILIDNAIKNSDAGAVIKISVRAEGKKGFLTVYNTGRGIAEKDIPQIFNRFYRADSSRARSTGGYGLGLTIAKSIADSHRGKITVKSEEGKYAEFTFMMPSC